MNASIESRHDDVEAYVLGALDRSEAERFEAHLAGCAPCRDGVAGYAGVMRAFRALRLPAPPPAPRVVRPYGGWALAALAAAFLVGLAIVAGVRQASGDRDVAAVAEIVTERPREIALAGATARGRVLVGANASRTAFLVSGLPPAPAGRGYQVWVRGAATRSPGMLRRTAGGLEILVVPGDVVAGAHHIGITIEPAGGSPKRTGPVEVSGDVL